MNSLQMLKMKKILKTIQFEFFGGGGMEGV
jgi:hypothetical protein